MIKCFIKRFPIPLHIMLFLHKFQKRSNANRRSFVCCSSPEKGHRIVLSLKIVYFPQHGNYQTLRRRSRLQPAIWINVEVNSKMIHLPQTWRNSSPCRQLQLLWRPGQRHRCTARRRRLRLRRACLGWNMERLCSRTITCWYQPRETCWFQERLCK